MGESSVSILREFWFEEIGCSESDITPNRVLVIPHGTMRGYKGVLFFLYNQACVVSAPIALVASRGIKTRDMSALTCFRPETIAALLEDNLDRIIGPAWLGQVAFNSYRKLHSEETRLLTESDSRHLEELLNSCSEDESSNSSLEVGRSPTVGTFDKDRLVAAAGYEVLAGKIAHIGVLTHPQHRGKGLAAKAISGITELALKANLGVQYRTLLSNYGSVGAGRKVGFRDFAETIAARVR